jgi:hypothetical protein
VVISPNGRTEPLRKRHAIHRMVHERHAAGVPAARLATVLPGSKFLSVDGHLTGDELAGGIPRALPEGPQPDRPVVPQRTDPRRRPHLGAVQPVGSTTVATLDALVALAPNQGFGYEPG